MSQPKVLLSQVANPLPVSQAIRINVGDTTTALTTGTAKATIRMPFAFTLTAIRGSLVTAQATGSTLVTFDVKKGGTSVFSTLPTFNNTATTTVGATTPAVLTTTALTDDNVITIDITGVDGATAAAGLTVTLIGHQ